MKNSILAAALAVSLSLAVPAMAQTAPSTDLATIQGGDFTLDKNHAKIIWSLSHLGFSTYYGQFTDFDASLEV